MDRKPFSMLGVLGTMTIDATARAPGCFQSQMFAARRDSGPNGIRTIVTVRFDDQCKNGHNTFSITGRTLKLRDGVPVSEESGGCIHDEIAEAFPELAHLIPWHLCSTDGPMHYVANTVFHAGDRDCYGLRKGEQRPITGPDGKRSYELVTVLPDGRVAGYGEVPKYIKEGEQPTEMPRLEYRLWCRTGEGKARELDAARRTAVWPDATDEQLSAEPGALKAMLEKRLPWLLSSFRVDMEACGFRWSAD